MNIIKKVIYTISVIIVMSCNSDKKSNDFLQINVDLEDNAIHLSDIFSSLKVVPLQTTDSSLIADRTQLKFSNQFIFIESNQSIKLFDYEGNFIQDFGRKGSGAGEYLGISDFCIDEQSKKIEILDKRQKKIFQYDYEGNYLGEIPLNFWALKFIRNTNNDLFVYNGNERDNDNKYKLRMFSNDKKSSFLEINPKTSKYLHIFNPTNFHKKNDEILLFEAFNDTIYTLGHNIVKPKYIISYNGRNVPSSFYESKKFSNVFEFFQEFKKYDYVNSTYNVFESETKLFFQCFKQTEKYMVSYDKNTKKTLSYNKIIDDLFSKGKELPFQESEITFIAENNTVMFMIQPLWLLENKISELYPNLNNLKEDDNPLLFIGKLK